MHAPLPLTRDLVLIGGGHAHALVLLKWAMDPLPGARLTLIDPNPVAPYTGMLPGHIAGHYPREALEMNLIALARRAGARMIPGRAEGLDPVAQTVITSDLPALPGFADHGVGAKPLGAYAGRWAAFVETAGPAPQIVVLGAGVGGVELALAMDHRLADRPGRRITLIERARALPHLGPRARARLLALLEARGIALLENAQAVAVSSAEVTLSDGRRIASDFTLAAAGSRPQGWLAATGLALHEGFVAVGDTLQSLSHPGVFAAGDCAHLSHAPRPKAGVFAVREAPFLFHNLRAALSGGAMRRYQPQRDYLKLISLGGKEALADKWGLPLQGAWLWRQKDRIDARFMAMVQSPPAMPAPALPRAHARGLAEALGDKPLCGGCGAKVGPATLRAALADLPVPEGTLGAGDDAALVNLGGARVLLATDHLRAVTEDPYLMARIAATHALGDLFAMGAAPQAALAHLILPRLSEPLQARTLAEITAGLRRVLEAEGVALVGGHTTLGSELTIGLTVTGPAPQRPLTKSGARPGDALILTKPLGSGVLLAAEMQGLAPGRAIAALWPMLCQSQAAAARLLAPHARALTDITGFGLAGHLDEMLSPALGARIDLAALPLYDGAEDLAATGLASSIAPANRAALLGRLAAPGTPRAALLVDPQTAGGLLAAIPPESGTTLLAALAAAGYSAARIGTIVAHQPGTPAITAA